MGPQREVGRERDPVRCDSAWSGIGSSNCAEAVPAGACLAAHFCSAVPADLRKRRAPAPDSKRKQDQHESADDASGYRADQRGAIGFDGQGTRFSFRLGGRCASYRNGLQFPIWIVASLRDGDLRCRPRRPGRCLGCSGPILIRARRDVRVASVGKAGLGSGDRPVNRQRRRQGEHPAKQSALRHGGFSDATGGGRGLDPPGQKCQPTYG